MTNNVKKLMGRLTDEMNSNGKKLMKKLWSTDEMTNNVKKMDLRLWAKFDNFWPIGSLGCIDPQSHE